MDALQLPEPVCAILAVRGKTDADDAKHFLRPRMDQLGDPELLADGPAAAVRIARAVRNGERIFIHGDYDVDGICASALLTRWLRSLGGVVTPFVPHRVRDGYDFSAAGLSAAHTVGATLIVTVDCGTTAHDTVALANEAGIDVIVTDHHTVGDDLPEALAVVNPQRADCSYPFKGLCGAGVAFRLGELVARECGSSLDELIELVDLVALATIADLVPLESENRVFVAYGLRRFPHTTLHGLRALLEVSDVPVDGVTAGRIGYQIGPRINAVGRMGESEDGLALLLSDDQAESRALAGVLDRANRERRDEDQRTLNEALVDLESHFDPERDFGVVLAGHGWHPGVIGIVASRVVERIHRPVVMIALDGESGRGSARSIPGFNLYDAIADCAEHLRRFGGHRQAAGMDLRAGALDAFRTAFNEAARARLEEDLLRPVLRPDVDVELGEIDLQLVHWLSYLGPHGVGNPGPLFRARNIEVVGARLVGSNHLKAELRSSSGSVDAIGFGLAERFAPASLAGRRWEALFRLERNEWRGNVRVQAKLADLRPGS
ncbi:MAG: single-stranded-DNA-specific exonuclease RecJ [Gemmatimonadota bacterium]|nr:single-stranded-DNA-specific exonuclease RecJ [Gemmatimonadota bacterium]